jgi:hypothetical protein
LKRDALPGRETKRDGGDLNLKKGIFYKKKTARGYFFKKERKAKRM